MVAILKCILSLLLLLLLFPGAYSEEFKPYSARATWKFADNFVLVNFEEGVLMSEAQKYCEVRGGSSLAKHITEKRHDEIVNLLGLLNHVERAWIGIVEVANASRTDREFEWIGEEQSGSFPIPKDVLRWNEGEPNHNGEELENCVNIYGSNATSADDIGNYNDLSCDSGELTHAVCERYKRNYTLVRGPKGISREEATEYCEERYGTSLATIQDERDMEEVFDMISTSGNDMGFWIGLHRSPLCYSFPEECKWRFDSGARSPSDEFLSSMAIKGEQPSNHNLYHLYHKEDANDCVVLLGALYVQPIGKWVTYHCSGMHEMSSFICDLRHFERKV